MSMFLPGCDATRKVCCSKNSFIQTRIMGKLESKSWGTWCKHSQKNEQYLQNYEQSFDFGELLIVAFALCSLLLIAGLPSFLLLSHYIIISRDCFQHLLT